MKADTVPMMQVAARVPMRRIATPVRKFCNETHSGCVYSKTALFLPRQAPSSTKQKMEKMVPLKFSSSRWIRRWQADIVPSIVFLLSNGASYITGEIIRCERYQHS
jgi:hypothetical protein